MGSNDNFGSPNLAQETAVLGGQDPVSDRLCSVWSAEHNLGMYYCLPWGVISIGSIYTDIDPYRPIAPTSGSLRQRT